MKRLQATTTTFHFSNLFSYHSKLLNTTESMDEERIETTMSNLPPEILRQIVSLIPLKEAVRTSTLSTSWKTLWTPFQVEFDSDPNQITTDTGDEASKNINQIVGLLSKSSSSPELWRFSLQTEKTQKPLFFSAAKGGGGGGGELHLDFLAKENEIQSNFNLVYDPTPRISNLSSIKTLHMVSVNKIAEGLVSTLFSSCRFLESLKLEKCSAIQSIDIKASDSLKSFEVVGCEELESIAISAPNLKSLWYRGALPLIQINGCLNLVDVVLDLREGFGRSEFDCEDVLNLFSSLKDVESLKISGWLLEWLCAAGVIFERLQFRFNKLKKLSWFDALMNQTKRDSLACFLHISPHLEILFVKIDQNLSSITCPYFHQFWHEPHLWMDYETVTSNVCQLERLKVIQLEGFRNEEDDQLMMLMDLLLRKSIALKSMTVISPEKQSRRVTKIPKSQLNQTSSPKRLVISSRYEDYFFGLIEDKNNFCWL
ncbi:F-box protein At2g39490-like isoform X2 [Rhododendron vialii]|uniref:F-box protein At2g39490-like isoform X2 n=1 Tax=Rhododendron vialii TaxID=182163 RepID=UPI00265E283A|nr:F-box protein At2g39490-like isoform X2 [Rhododendron vialii]